MENVSSTVGVSAPLGPVSTLLNNSLHSIVSLTGGLLEENNSLITSNIPPPHHHQPYEFHCKDGLILPCWTSDGHLSTILLHGLVYLLALIYSFVGVAIIADRFMSSIEQITSQEKDIVVRRPNGEKEIVSVRIWNETVSNLTLMALGSSAPEIMLSVIEIYAQDFEAGDLGPGTVVGSAAFNMFIIIAVCVWAVPSSELKKIKYLRVFIITMAFSVFAYLWLLMILVWFSPGVIEVWEGLVTLFYFYLTVQIAYIADKRLLIYKYLDKRYRLKSKVYLSANGTQTSARTGGEEGTDAEKMELNKIGKEDEPKEAIRENGTTDDGQLSDSYDKNVRVFDITDDELRLIEDHRENILEILKDVQSRFPNKSAEEIEEIARNEISKLQPKSRAYYRRMAAQRILGNDQYSSRETDSPTHQVIAAGDPERSLLEPHTILVYFDPKEYTVMEDVGSLLLTVRRSGNLNSTIAVTYSTEDGSARANADYVAKCGVVTFGPTEAYKQISIDIINDEEFEEDEHFFVKLADAHYVSAAMDVDEAFTVVISEGMARVNILDDDHSGVFSFVNNVFQIPETIGDYQLAVHRYRGARGQVLVPYRTIPATAKPNEDFVMASGELVFHNNQTQRYINLEIINNVNYEKNSIFYVELYEPTRVDDLPLDERGAPRLGDLTKCMIRIRESKDLKQIVDNLMRSKKRSPSYLDRTGSWENQIISAVRVHKLSTSIGSNFSDRINDPESPKRSDVTSTGDVGSEEEPKSLCDYVMHYLTLFWKVAFIFVPPAHIWNGWACFLVSITMIGLLTALINDLASHFGSTVHMKDSVTAISLVALGTSVPDTFASKIAAQNEKNADSSIGNVTGSNAVNVFLGIGLAWTVAAVYHAVKGTTGGFQVEPGNLCFSVFLYCICAFICATILMVRRFYIGGELGGPIRLKIITVMCFGSLWLFYVIMSTLEAYDVIAGF